MNQSEMVTDFKLTDGDKRVTVAALMRGLNTYLKSIRLEPDEYGFTVLPLIEYPNSKEHNRLPEKYWRLVAFAVEGGSEGYYIHVAVLDNATRRYTDLGLAKTFSADNAHSIVREAQRFLMAAGWN